MKAGLVLAVKPNSTACRAADGFGNLWPSACSLPPAAAQRLLFSWWGEGEQEEKGDLSLCILTYPIGREESGSVWWQGGQSQPVGPALLLQMFPSW